ncbi:zinc ribbon domain-containing protein [Neobacillus soli]|uniref:zinc ribbon domain-containing protein n=1 Tax=Neobacillus soli TaxID=220688 RepID=UPI000824FDB3|nr:zinc ribbon domain-containing protein [Neobacillus soli]
MYCKNCGAENSPLANYCIHDGTVLKRKTMNYHLKEQTAAFCSSCGAKSVNHFNYCTECGTSNSQYVQDKGLAVPKELTNLTAAIPKKLPSFNLTYVKKALLPVLIAVIIMIGLSFSVMKSSERLYNSLLSDSMKDFNMENLNDLISEMELKTDSNLPKLGKLYGITDIVMMSNLQNPVVSVNMNGNFGGDSGKATAEAEAKNGFLIYLLIPFIGLFAAGIFAARRNRSSNLPDHLVNAIGIGVLYALFMAVFSLFAGFSYHFNINESGVKMAFAMDTHYSLFKTLSMTLIVGFIFSGLGSLFATNFRKTTGHLSEWIPSGEAIHQAIAVPFRGILLFSIGLFIYFSSKIADFKEQFGDYFFNTPFEKIIDKSYVFVATISVQLGSYLWNLLQLTPLTLFVNQRREAGSLSYGIFSGFVATGAANNDSTISEMESALSQVDLDMYLKLALLIPIALLIWAGFKIALKPQHIKNLIIFSVIYAVIMTGLAAFTDIGVSMIGHGTDFGDSMNVSMGLGFSPAGTFIKSLLLSFVFAFLGTLIHKFKADGQRR